MGCINGGAKNEMDDKIKGKDKNALPTGQYAGPEKNRVSEQDKAKLEIKSRVR